MLVDRRTLAAGPESSRVVGIVMDVNDARVVGATVRFESNGTTVSGPTDEAGEFALVLPVSPRPYSYTVDATGFCKFYGELRGARPSQTDALNIHLEVYTREDCPCSKRFKGKAPAPN
jgi:hypothetical protein